MGVTIRKKDGRWFIFINHNGRRKAKSVGTKAAAEQVKKIIEAKLALGEFDLNTDDKDVLPTFKEYAARWLKSYISVERKSSTYRSNEQLLRNHVYPRFGDRRLNEITREEVKAFVAELSEATKDYVKPDAKEAVQVPRFSRSTMRLIISAMRGVYNSAIEDRLVELNPAARVGRFAKSKKQKRQAKAMTFEEAQRFLTASREVCSDFYEFFLTTLRAGLRRGEMVALQWGDIHFGKTPEDPNRYILVQHNYVNGEFTDPKSHRVRRVDLTRELRAALLALREKRQEAGVPVGPQDLVFPSKAGTPLAPDNIFVRYMKPALKAANLGHFTLHDLRHTFGSHLLQKGAPLPYVRDQMGHYSIQVTVDIYGHLVPGADIAWVDRLDEKSTGKNSPEPNRTDKEEHAAANA